MFHVFHNEADEDNHLYVCSFAGHLPVTFIQLPD